VSVLAPVQQGLVSHRPLRMKGRLASSEASCQQRQKVAQCFLGRFLRQEMAGADGAAPHVGRPDLPDIKRVVPSPDRAGGAPQHQRWTHDATLAPVGHVVGAAVAATVQETAAFTSSTTFFSTTGLHFWSAYDTGHRSPSSRLAASWKPRVEYR
jgi:hypothetical protein